MVEGVGEAILFALLPLVLLEMPGEAHGELSEIDVERHWARQREAGGVRRRNPDGADNAPIAVLLVPVDAHVPANHGTGETLL